MGRADPPPLTAGSRRMALLRISSTPAPPVRYDQPVADFAAWATAYGGYGAKVREPGELPTALSTALAHDGPALVDVDVDPHEPPLPGKVSYEQAKGFAQSWLRGQPHKAATASTMFKDRISGMRKQVGRTTSSWPPTIRSHPTPNRNRFRHLAQFRRRPVRFRRRPARFRRHLARFRHLVRSRRRPARCQFYPAFDHPEVASGRGHQLWWSAKVTSEIAGRCVRSTGMTPSSSAGHPHRSRPRGSWRSVSVAMAGSR
jgi:Thiamine pyrophosphate enzyme, C-terminal TPP binding domain